MMKTCQVCKKDFKAARKDAKYCSVYCRNKRNRKPQVRKKVPCGSCGNLVTKRGLTVYRCNICKIHQYGEKTIADVLQIGNGQRYRQVRNHAVTVASKLLPRTPCKCGYDKHVELAHIVGVAKFPLDTKLNDVNSVNNLCWLCPNCHWELDHP